jgi:chitin synthase
LFSLFNGHLVLDVEVPNMYMDKVPLRDELEFTKMRYTAITCDPNDFVVSPHLVFGAFWLD